MLPTRRVAVTAVTRFELLAGARSGGEAQRLRTFLEPLPVLAFDRDAADRASSVGSQLREKGLSLATADLAIAGICMELDASLLTRNRRHFERIEGLPPGAGARLSRGPQPRSAPFGFRPVGSVRGVGPTPPGPSSSRIRRAPMAVA